MKDTKDTKVTKVTKIQRQPRTARVRHGEGVAARIRVEVDDRRLGVSRQALVASSQRAPATGTRIRAAMPSARYSEGREPARLASASGTR